MERQRLERTHVCTASGELTEKRISARISSGSVLRRLTPVAVSDGGFAAVISPAPLGSMVQSRRGGDDLDLLGLGVVGSQVSHAAAGLIELHSSHTAVEAARRQMVCELCEPSG